jgi:hypothetical protein
VVGVVEDKVEEVLPLDEEYRVVLVSVYGVVDDNDEPVLVSEVKLALLKVLLDIVCVVVLDGCVVVQLGSVVVPAVVLLGRDV